MTPAEVEAALHRAFVRDPGATLRTEDRRKAALLAALLPEVQRLARRGGGVLVDAAAGRGLLGLLAALDARPSHPWEVLCLERDPTRVARGQEAAARLDLNLTLRAADLGVDAAWPHRPQLVVALHACGAATDLALAQALRVQARAILLLPCCYGGGREHPESPQPPAQAAALAWAAAAGMPRQALVRGRVAQGLIDALRTLRLEAAGYRVEVLEPFSPALSPFNRLWRARYSGEPVAAARAQQALEQLERSLGLEVPTGSGPRRAGRRQ